MTEIFYLSHRAILELKGADSAKLLQGLITNDINNADSSAILYAFMLTPQGKFLYDFFIYKTEEGFYLDVLKARKEEIIAKLNMYKLRSAVVIKDVSEQLKVYASLEAFSDMTLPDPRNLALGYRLISDQQLPVVSSTLPLDLARIKQKIPDAESDFIYEKSFPLEYRALELNAISLSKGCYVGQEVISRTYHRGVVRKTIFLLKVMQGKSPAKGQEILQEKNKIGIALGFYGDLGLGLLNIEEVEKNKVFNTTDGKLQIVE